MLEKEIKILDIDIEVVQKQLLDFGAEKTLKALFMMYTMIFQGTLWKIIKGFFV